MNPATKTNEQSSAQHVWAVVLAYNNLDDTVECIESCLLTEHPNFHIVLSDNGSSDGTVEHVRTHYPTVHVLDNGENLGVPAGYNVGVHYALERDADFILQLNNDTTIPPTLVGELVDSAENDPEVGIYMPKVAFYDHPDEIWSLGARYRKLPPEIIMEDGSEYLADEPQFLEYAPGCCLLIRREAFEAAGLFDPGYLFLYDDWDFCERVRATGLKIRYVPHVTMLHKVSRTTHGPKSPLFWQVYGDSLVKFYRRHGKPMMFSIVMHIGYIYLREMVYNKNYRFSKIFLGGVKSGFAEPLAQIPAAPAIIRDIDKQVA